MIYIKIPPLIDYDVIIVGAGPAGSAAATYMARAGLRILLLDQQVFPRDKVCGDFVGPVALLELERLGVTTMAGYKQSNVIHNAALYLNGKHLITNAIPDVPNLPSHGRVIPRKTLDQWIVKAASAAGVQLLEGCRAQSFKTDPEGITLTIKQGNQLRQLRTRMLVGADGSNSVIARLMRDQPITHKDRIIAVRAYFEGISGPADQADLYFTAESFPGYYWLFPTSATAANVGIGMVLETLPRTSDHLRELLLQLIEQDAALHERLRHAHIVGKIFGWPLTTYNPYLPIVSDRVILIGDAAGLINPLNGEGIQYALLSARWAAETLVDCIRKDDFSLLALQSYTTRVQQELRYDMALASLIVQLIRNRSLNSIWLKALRVIVTRARVDSAYADITGGVLAGLVPARKAISVKVIKSTVEQAILSLGVDIIKNTLKGPTHGTQLGWDAVQASLEATSTMAQNPADFMRWGFGVAISTAELAGQVLPHLGTLPGNTESSDDHPPTLHLSIQ